MPRGRWQRGNGKIIEAIIWRPEIQMAAKELRVDNIPGPNVVDPGGCHVTTQEDNTALRICSARVEVEKLGWVAKAPGLPGSVASFI
jgi:hypothetical protein